MIAHAEETLAKTPEMLPVLKEAGVVDSGGQGLLEVYHGAYDGFLGKEIDYTQFDKAKGPAVTKIDAQTEADIKFGYCTEFIILLNQPMSEETEHEFKKFLMSLGDSIVLVADDEIVKVHVHTNHPGQAIEKALTFGALSRMKIDNMREEHQEKLIKDAEKMAKEQAEQEEKEEAAQPPKEVGFISVSVGKGMTEIFKELGVDYLIEGGQTMNPSTEDMLNAIAKVNAKTIYIFPNNKNIVLAANQARDLTEDKEIVVVPTKTIPQGITAMISYVPENHQVMTDLREEKVARIANDLPEQEVYGNPEGGDILVVGWGGTYGHLYTTVSEMRAEGKDVSLAHFNFINPLPKNTRDVLARYKKIVVCELNLGQFAKYLKSKFPEFNYLQVNKVAGLPFTVVELKEKINKII